MSSILTAVIGFAVLFALFGVYGLLSTRSGCAGSCGTCGSNAACSRSEGEPPQGH